MVAPHPQESSTSAHIARGITGFSWTRALEVLSDPYLDPLFWRAEWLGSPTAWWQRAFCALDCMRNSATALRRSRHRNRGSDAAFCQAVLREELATRCHSVDTRAAISRLKPMTMGFQEFRRFHDEQFGAFSRRSKV
jgi:hypothetical protein